MTLAELADGIVTVGFLSAVETGQKLIHREKLAALRDRLERAAAALPTDESARVLNSLHARLRDAISRGEREQAEDILQQLRVESSGDEPQLMLAEGQVEATFGDRENAYGYFQAAIWRLPKPSGDWFRAVIDFCQLCIELDKDIEARNTGIEAVQLCSSFKLAADTELELRSTVASVVSNLGEPNAALELLQVSPQVVDAASDWGRVTLLWAEATAHSDLGDTEKAVSRANEALKLLKPLRREFSFARLQNTVAAFEIQRDHPDWDRAERLLASAVATFRRLGAEVDLGQTLGTTGDMWARRGDLGAAKAAFAEALASVPDSAGALKACIHVEQATAFLRANATEEAREHLQSARFLLNSERPTRYQLQLWHRLAFMFEQKGDLGAAMLCIKEAAR